MSDPFRLLQTRLRTCSGQFLALKRGIGVPLPVEGGTPGEAAETLSNLPGRAVAGRLDGRDLAGMRATARLGGACLERVPATATA